MTLPHLLLCCHDDTTPDFSSPSLIPQPTRSSRPKDHHSPGHTAQTPIKISPLSETQSWYDITAELFPTAKIEAEGATTSRRKNTSSTSRVSRPQNSLSGDRDFDRVRDRRVWEGWIRDDLGWLEGRTGQGEERVKGEGGMFTRGSNSGVESDGDWLGKGKGRLSFPFIGLTSLVGSMIIGYG